MVTKLSGCMADGAAYEEAIKTIHFIISIRGICRMALDYDSTTGLYTVMAVGF